MILIILYLILLWFVIAALLNIWRRDVVQTESDKLLWTILVVVIPLIGVILYVVVKKVGFVEVLKEPIMFLKKQ